MSNVEQLPKECGHNWPPQNSIVWANNLWDLAKFYHVFKDCSIVSLC